MPELRSTYRRAGWLLAAVPFFGIATGAMFPLIALELDRAGFDEAFIGTVTSLYYAGSVTGALTYGWLVNRVGYKAAFIAISLLAGAASFALTQFDEPSIWLVLRFVGGYALGGYYIVVDSWVSALGTRQTRGRLFATYEALRLLATASGPSLIVIGATTESFTAVSVGYFLAFWPALLNEAPPPQTRKSSIFSNLTSISRCFPFALAVAFCGGVANASFYGLSAVYAKGLGLEATLIAVFVGVVLVAPAITEIPIGALADRYRRMPLAASTSFAAMLACLFLALHEPSSFGISLAASITVGGCLVPLYALGLSRIVDSVGERDAVKATTAGLLAYNGGALCGPFLAGVSMEIFGGTGLYIFLGAVSAIAMTLSVLDTRPSSCCPENSGKVLA